MRTRPGRSSLETLRRQPFQDPPPSPSSGLGVLCGSSVCCSICNLQGLDESLVSTQAVGASFAGSAAHLALNTLFQELGTGQFRNLSLSPRDAPWRRREHSIERPGHGGLVGRATCLGFCVPSAALDMSSQTRIPHLDLPQSMRNTVGIDMQQLTSLKPMMTMKMTIPTMRGVRDGLESIKQTRMKMGALTRPPSCRFSQGLIWVFAIFLLPLSRVHEHARSQPANLCPCSQIRSPSTA